jgi:hypothetical protein
MHGTLSLSDMLRNVTFTWILVIAAFSLLAPVGMHIRRRLGKHVPARPYVYALAMGSATGSAISILNLLLRLNLEDQITSRLLFFYVAIVLILWMACVFASREWDCAIGR